MKQEHMQDMKTAAGAVLPDGETEEQAAQQGRWPIGLHRLGQRYYAARQNDKKR